MVTKENTHIQKALVIALVLIIVDVFLHITHQKVNNSFANLYSPISLSLSIVVSIFYYNKTNENALFSAKFSYGFKVTAAVVCILFLYNILAIYIVFPNYVIEVFKSNVEQAKQIKGFNQDQVNANKMMAQKVIGISYMSYVVLIHLAAGLIASAFGGLLKNK